MTYPINGSDLRPMAFSGAEGEKRSFDIILDVVDYVRTHSADATGVKDITQRGNIGDNLDKLKIAIEMGKIPAVMSQFRIAAEVQKRFWAATADRKIIIPEFPHHENIKWSEDQWVSESGLVIAPLSYVFGPIVTNPHSFDKTPKQNIDFVAHVGRVQEMIERTAQRFELSPNEVAEAGSVYCNTVVAKRAWSIAANGDIDPGQVAPGHFLAVAGDGEGLLHDLGLVVADGA